MEVVPDQRVIIHLFGCNFHHIDKIMFTPSRGFCSDGKSNRPIDDNDFERISEESMTVIDAFPVAGGHYYVCFAERPLDLNPNETIINYQHQGDEPYKSLVIKEKERHYYMPVPIQIVIIAVLLIFSGLFSGLNLGLMALDRTELQIVLNSGSVKERDYAEKIIPIRKTGNYLLCTLLLGNVIVNSAISILFDDLTSGLIALVCSSIGIVILGEIVPQAICSRYGLAIGARTIWITKFFMVLTFPLSFPISKILDRTLGEEVGNVYNKERLLELIRLSKDHQTGLQGCQEVQIVSGALELAKKTVKDVMTHIRDVYMITIETVLDPIAVSEIVQSGYTRIPVYDGSKDNVVALLNVKGCSFFEAFVHFLNRQYMSTEGIIF